jgi:hypothetical protein
MDSLHSAYNHHAFAFWVGLLVVVVIVAIWLLVVQSRQRRLSARIDEIFAGVSGDETARMLADYLSIVRSTAASIDRVKQEHDQLISLAPGMIRHVGLVRFSPFHDTGGDQSFALALLDGKRNGVMVTALHSRTESRLYAKPIEGGTSEYALTAEERAAIERALHGAPVPTPS